MFAVPIPSVSLVRKKTVREAKPLSQFAELIKDGTQNKTQVSFIPNPCRSGGVAVLLTPL